MGHTSTEVKRRYNERVYKQLNIQIPLDMYDRFKAICKANGITQRQALMILIADFIDANGG